MPPLLPRLSLLPRSLLPHHHRPFSTTRASLIAKITIVGRLAAQPELTPTSTGQEVVKYSLGTSYGPPDARQTSWWKVASFVEEGSRRDRLLGLQKGTLVYVEGDASMRSFENREGQKQNSLSIVQQRLEVLKRPTDQSAETAEDS
ncbi:ssDNA-binding protein, mitochondrial [Lignoscripta atroalba]|nr:ssDNA-binding protein, mitochondrial [Lignoscripta atroalba]